MEFILTSAAAFESVETHSHKIDNRKTTKQNQIQNTRIIIMMMLSATTKPLAIAVQFAALAATSSAFSMSPQGLFGPRIISSSSRDGPSLSSAVLSNPDANMKQDLHLERVAAKLAAEADAFESQQQEERHEAAEKVFESLDTNHDGELSFDELRMALEATLKEELEEDEIAEVMACFEDNLLELAGQVHLMTSGPN